MGRFYSSLCFSLNEKGAMIDDHSVNASGLDKIDFSLRKARHVDRIKKGQRALRQ